MPDTTPPDALTDQRIPANDFERDNCMHCTIHRPVDDPAGKGWWSCDDWMAGSFADGEGNTEHLYRDGLDRLMCHKAKPPEHEGQMNLEVK